MQTEPNESGSHGRADDTVNRHRLHHRDFEPAYLRLFRSEELHDRGRYAVNALSACIVCPRDCAVDRLADKTATCNTGRYAQVASHFPHMGEEDCLRGWRGSGTIFFGMCNLRCVFCQNFDISQADRSRVVSPHRLAGMMLELQHRGCHNINFVTPEHVVPQILEALVLAVEEGLSLPIVYNTSAYDSMESLRLLDGVVDIYMPDFKIWEPEKALRYLLAKDYPDVARNAIVEMHRQVGPLVFDERGLAQRGVLVRHLLMPGDMAGTEDILRFLSEQVSGETYVNLMDQYRPAGRVRLSKFRSKYKEIDRRVSPQEIMSANDTALKLGLRLDSRQSLQPL